MKTSYRIGLAVLFIAFVLPLAIVSIYMSQTQGGECDYEDAIGLNIKEYLFIGGIVNIAIVLAVVIGLCISLVTSIPLYILLALNTAFSIIWFVIGGIVLFRSNLECIREGSVPVIYALVLWCLSILGCVM